MMDQVVFNCTKQTLVVSELEIAETAISRLKGLIGRSAEDFPHGRGLWIFPSEGIHTIGMSFPIDVAYLDGSNRVVHTYHGLQPFRIARVKLRAKSILELPAGTLGESKTEVGDLLQFLVARQERDREHGALQPA
jgi:uncharacterized protein